MRILSGKRLSWHKGHFPETVASPSSCAVLKVTFSPVAWTCLPNFALTLTWKNPRLEGCLRADAAGPSQQGQYCCPHLPSCKQHQFWGGGQGSGEMEVGRPIKMRLQWQQRLNIDVLVTNRLAWPMEMQNDSLVFGLGFKEPKQQTNGEIGF